MSEQEQFEQWFENDTKGLDKASARAGWVERMAQESAELEQLRAKLAAYESQAPARIVMPPPPYNPDLEPERMTDYERGEAQGRCDMWAEIKRLNAVQQEGGE